jgi:SulP family sulfate permease
MLPKAMAYAAVAGVPPAYGLYASCAAPALAVAFGSNRLLFTGPVGVMTVLVLGALHHFAQPFSPAYIELSASLTLMVAVLTLLLAAARLGFLVRAIPIPVTEGFIAGGALLIIGTQVSHALGAPPPTARAGIHLPAFLAEAAEAWSRRDVLVPALSASCIAIALLARRLLPQVPEALTVVALSVAITLALGLRERGVEMVGALPIGFPPLSAPSLAPLLSAQLWGSAALLTLVGMTETCSLSRFVALRTGQPSDPGREVTLCLGPLFAFLPRFALAVVVMLAVGHLLDPRRLIALSRAGWLDGLVALTTFSVTLLVGPERGILAGVAAAVLCLPWRARHLPEHRAE